MPDLTKAEAAKQAALQELSKLKAKAQKRGPGRPKKAIENGWLAQAVSTEKRKPGRPKKTDEVVPKNLVDIEKRKPGRPKGPGKHRGPGRPKGTEKRRAPGRPKGLGRRLRHAGGQGLIGGLVAKRVKVALQIDQARSKVQIERLVAREVKKALKTAFS